MKKVTVGCVYVGMMLSTQIASAQQSVNAAGRDATGSGGSVAYSIGQPFYRVSGTSITTSEGVQQPIEITVGLDEQNLELSMVAFPNPSYDVLNLRIEDFQDQDLTYQLIDATGRLVLTENINQDETQISVKELESGTYYLQVMIEQSRLKTFTLIKH